MQNSERIQIIIKKLEKTWKANPNYRLGQIITIATRPSKPHPSTFYIEDDELLRGLQSLNKPIFNNLTTTPYWEKYPNVCTIDENELNDELVQEYLSILFIEKYKETITPIKLMELNGAPIGDKFWISKQNNRITKLRQILSRLKVKGILQEVEIGYQLTD